MTRPAGLSARLMPMEFRTDYGFTFVNLEAIHYGIATEENTRRKSWSGSVANAL